MVWNSSLAPSALSFCEVPLLVYNSIFNVERLNWAMSNRNFSENGNHKRNTLYVKLKIGLSYNVQDVMWRFYVCSFKLCEKTESLTCYCQKNCEKLFSKINDLTEKNAKKVMNVLKLFVKDCIINLLILYLFW